MLSSLQDCAQCFRISVFVFLPEQRGKAILFTEQATIRDTISIREQAKEGNRMTIIAEIGLL